MKPMLPTLAFKPPAQGEWLYEIKYDGFRGILVWTKDECFLWSRNGKDLLPQFPEIKSFLLQYQEAVSDSLPLILDGELCILENEWKANFEQIQIRGRLRSKDKIEMAAADRPCTYLAFDLLSVADKSTSSLPYLKRKEELLTIFTRFDSLVCPFKIASHFKSYKKIKEIVKDHDSEGIVAKLANGVWEEGKRTSAWIKIKNWKTVSCFLTAFDDNNGFFHVGVWKSKKVVSLGLFVNGLNSETKNALRESIIRNFNERKDSLIQIQPGICLDLHYLEWKGEQLREPYFKNLRLDLDHEQCTYEHFLASEAAFPEEVVITHPEKKLWHKNSITKLDYLRYLKKSSAFLLPFLKDRLLTVIRAPHGEFGEAFYQKSIPESAPSFVQSHMYESNEMIVCNDLKSLIWLGNQLAIEFHIPFQTIKSQFVSEIVLDLDPPSREYFSLARKAALILKDVLDQLKLTSFVKLSGNKGMQIYIPLPDNRYTWEDTRHFTEFIAKFLITYDPQSYTIERLKRNRAKKLYIDFIQHAEGKTIIAPYSVRNNSDNLVAAPLFWHEVNDHLIPDDFTMETVLKRIEVFSDPFSLFFHSKKTQPFHQVLQMIKEGESN
ncbi:DNA ligase D [Lederbergia citrea]|uniref:DNA ligase D n=1 Tax=Lederbergia citrea TaxID=2833581 RepID=A0A942UNF8_9BACI|nr:DNA ligase D [Lederbergia citrea]MBS4222101.1 DNA ligase D [Lederbergia citrea]